MNRHRDNAPSTHTEYFLVGEGDLGRIMYHAQAGGIAGAEILDGDGRWQARPFTDILNEGMPIDVGEARKRAREIGGVL